METFLSFILILSFWNSAAAKEKVSGTAIKIQDAPYMVHIEYQSFKNQSFGIAYLCGGTILNRQYILTAGHCEKKYL